MAKRRILKKQVNYVIGELFLECTVVAKLTPNVSREKSDAVLLRILEVQNDYISRISHTEPGNVKGFYKKFHEGFQVEVDSILEQIGNLHD